MRSGSSDVTLQRSIVLAAFMAVFLLAGSAAWGATLTWDATPGTTGAQEGGGNWDTTSNNWWTGSANTTWTNSPPDSAIFGVGGTGTNSYTVNLTEPITAGTLTFNSGANYTLSGGTLTRTVTSVTVNAPEARIDSVVAGVRMNKYGSGRLILAGNNTLSGGAMDTVAGVVNLRHNNALGGLSYCHIYVAGTALEVQNNITVSNGLYVKGYGVGGTGSLRSVSGNNTWAGWVNLYGASDADAAIGVDAGSTLTISGPIQPYSGGSEFHKVGEGKLILTNNNTYNWPTYVDAGVLNIRNSGALGTTGAGTTVIAGAALEMENDITVGTEALTLNGSGIANNGALRSISGDNTWNGTVVENSARIRVDADTLTINGQISGSGTFVKTGAGKLILTGTNSYSATTDVAQGVLNIRDSSALGISSYCHVYSGATLELENSLNVSRTLYIGNSTSGDTTLGLHSVSGNNIWGDWVRLHGSHPHARIGVEAGSTLTISGQIQPHDGSGGSLTKLGAGTLIFTRDNTYDAPTYVEEGILNIRDGSALGTTTAGNGTTVSSGATLEMQGDITVAAEALTLNGGGVSGNGALRSISGDNFWNGNIVENSARIRVDADTLTINGQISGSGTFRKYGNGKLILTAANNYAATTDVADGVLNIRDGMALGTVNYCHVFSGATLELENNITVSRGLYIGNNSAGDTTVGLRNVSGDNIWNGYVRLHSSHPHARVSVDAGSTLTVNGNIELYADGTGSLIKLGDGTMIVNNAANTFNSPTIVEEGTLLVNGSIAASPSVSVVAGATLGGSGIVPVVDGDGLVSPGNSPGILTAPSIDPGGGLDFAFEFTSTGAPDYSNATASVNDVLRLTDGSAPFAGLLDGDNSVGIYLNVAGLAEDDVFTGGFYTDLAGEFLGEIEGAQFEVFVKGDGGGSNAFGGVSYYTLGEYNSCMSLSVDTIAQTAAFASGSVNGYVMQLTTAVPEPTSCLLALFGLLGFGYLVRRRR